MSVAAVLWDMDGLLIDSEPLWTVAEQDLAQRHGTTFGPELKRAVVGTRLDVAVPLLLRGFGVEATAEQVALDTAWMLARMVELFSRGLAPRPGSLALLAEVAAAGVPQALVSSSYRVLVDTALATGLGPFATTVAGDEVIDGKPSPEPYLTAAARLGAQPARCVVLEDSAAGVTAGEAAGAAVLAVPSVPGVSIRPGPRRRVVASLAEVGLADLQSLLEAAVGGSSG